MADLQLYRQHRAHTIPDETYIHDMCSRKQGDPHVASGHIFTLQDPVFVILPQ